MQKIWKDYGAITIGTILIGLATKNIFDPASMVTGGVSGIAIIGKELWNLPLWVTNTVLNIPLFLAGFKIMGWKFIKRTLYATVLLSVAFYILPEGMYIEDDLLLSALFGGIITGVGTGLVLAGGCTTGGTDMLAALIRAKFPHYSVAQIMQVLDGLVVVAGATVFGIRAALYALIAIFCMGKVADGLIEGMKFSKQAFIISDHYQEIANAIMTESSLSFLGLGIQQPMSSWGSLLQNAQSYMQNAIYMAILPGLLIVLTIFAFNKLGNLLRIFVEPRVMSGEKD